MSKNINLEGQRLGRLTVIKDTQKRAHNGGVIWLCQCDCGNLTESRGDHLKRGLIQSCNCLHDELFKINSIKWHQENPDFFKGKNNPFWGKHHSEKTKRKISKGNNGNKGKYNPFWRKNHTEKTKIKMSEKGKLRIGDKSPRWLGGISFEPYGLEFNKKLKYEIRKRDDFICQFPNCGIKENGKAHDCHHISYIKKDNRPENFTTLCQSCHPKTNTNREYWENYFKEKSSALYPHR